MKFMSNRPAPVSPATNNSPSPSIGEEPPLSWCMQGQLPTLGRYIFFKIWDDLPHGVASEWLLKKCCKQGREDDIWGKSGEGSAGPACPCLEWLTSFHCQHPHQQSPTSPLGPSNHSVDRLHSSVGRNASIPVSLNEADLKHKSPVWRSEFYNNLNVNERWLVLLRGGVFPSTTDMSRVSLQ